MAVSATLVDSTIRSGAASFASVPGGSAFSDRVLFGWFNSYDSNFWPLYPVTIGGISAVRQDMMTAAAVVPTGTTHTWAGTGATDCYMSGVYSLSGGANPRPVYSIFYNDFSGSNFTVDVPHTAGSTIVCMMVDNGGGGIPPTIVSGITSDGTIDTNIRFAHIDKASAGTATITIEPSSGATNVMVYVFDAIGPDWQFIGMTTPVSANSGDLNLGGEPSGSAQDDILIAGIGYRSNAAFTVPSGWTSAASSNTGNTTTAASTAIPSGILAYAIRGASAPASFTFTRTSGSFAMGRIAAYRHKNAGTPSFDTAVATISGSAVYSVSGAAMTVANAGSLLFAGLITTPYGGYINNVGAPNTTPAYWGSADYNTWAGDNGSGVGVSGGEFFSTMASSGSTGTIFGIVGQSLNSYGLMLSAAFAPPTGDGGLTASLFTDTDTFFSPTVVGPRELSPSLFADTDAFFTPTVTRLPIFGELLGTLGVNAGSITSSFSATGSVDVSVGDLIVSVVCQQTNLTVTGVTDNLGNSYSAQNAGTDAGNVTGRCFYSIATNAGTLTTVTAACTGSTNDGVHIAAVIKGPFQSIDANVANITSDVTSPFTCPSSGTLAQAQEVVIGWGVASYGTAWSATSPNLEAVERANSTTIKAIIGYQAVSATTAVSPAFTAGSNPGQAVLGTLSFRRNLLQALTADLFVDSDTFFQPTVSQSVGTQDLTPALFSDTDVFFQPTVTPGAVGLTASLFTDTDVFPSPTVNSTYPLTASLVVDTDSFYVPTAAPGAVTLTAGLFTDTDSFFQPTVAPGAVNLTAALFTDTDTFYTHTLTLSQSLVPGLYTDADAFYQPTVTPGAVTLSPSLFTDTDAFHSPVVATGGSLLAPDLFVDDDVFFQPTVVPGAVTLTASLVVDNDQFFSPAITVGGVTLTAGLFADTDSFFSPSVTSLAATEPALFTDTDVFFAPTVSTSKTLTPDLFVDTDTFYTQAVVQDQVLPSHFVDTDVFFSATVTPGAVTIYPPHFVDVDTIQAHHIQHGQIGGGTSAAKGNRGLEKVRKKWPKPTEPKAPEIPLPPIEVVQPKPVVARAPEPVVDRRSIPDLAAMQAEAQRLMDEQDMEDIAEILALLD